MIVRIFIVFLLFIHAASLEVTVEGVIGGSVVLPCSGADQSSIEDININWRHNESLIVYDINKGIVSVKDQGPQYKNRTESFSEVYLKGNFSLQMNNLQETDAGKYSCYINKESVIREVKLLVKEKSEDQSNHKPEKSEDQSKGGQTKPEMIVTVFLLPISILVFM